MQRCRRQGAPGARLGPRPSRPQPCPAPLEELGPAPRDTLQSAAQVPGTVCPPGCQAEVPGSWESPGPTARSGDARPGIPGERGLGRGASGHRPAIHCRSQQSPQSRAAASSGLPPGVLTQWSSRGRQRQHAERGGVFPEQGLRTAVLLLGRPRGAPTQPAPLAGFRRRGSRARGSRGDAAPHGGSRKGRPEGSRGLPAASSPCPCTLHPGGSRVGGTGP